MCYSTSQSTMDFKLVLLVAAAVAGCFAKDFGPEFTGTLRTTRQWDCCKPQYGWLDNLKGAAPSPVRSCLADGETTADINAQPACHKGGPASACNNQQPFVIGDHAYAFVAGENINGNKDVGCTCWELTFKEGPVKGKKMTVQVINGGAADVMENHFDVQIPMSGRGLFPEGCINQWGLEDKVWGGPYGGVNTMEECLKGPKSLHRGCEFRFGSWWQNADNPHADFKRVSCPKVITDITGCKRYDDE